MKVGDRIKFKEKGFLANGFIKSIYPNAPFDSFIVIKLDEKAPNEYAYETDEVLAFANEIEVIQGN